MGSMSNKSLPLDILPNSLLHSGIEVFSKVIAQLANISFVQGTFPMWFKKAKITHFVKHYGRTNLIQPAAD